MDHVRFEVLGQARSWRVSGDGAAVDAANGFLAHLADRGYAGGTLRGYAYDLLAWCRWLDESGRGLELVDTATVLDFLAA